MGCSSDYVGNKFGKNTSDLIETCSKISSKVHIQPSIHRYEPNLNYMGIQPIKAPDPKVFVLYYFLSQIVFYLPYCLLHLYGSTREITLHLWKRKYFALGCACLCILVLLEWRSLEYACPITHLMAKLALWLLQWEIN